MRVLILSRLPLLFPLNCLGSLVYITLYPQFHIIMLLHTKIQELQAQVKEKTRGILYINLDFQPSYLWDKEESMDWNFEAFLLTSRVRFILILSLFNFNTYKWVLFFFFDVRIKEKVQGSCTGVKFLSQHLTSVPCERLCCSNRTDSFVSTSFLHMCLFALSLLCIKSKYVSCRAL